MTARIIDIHPHIISPDTQRYPIAPIGGKRSVWSAEHPRPFEDLVAGMNEAGIEKACIVHSSTTYGFDASYVADVVKENSERFTGTFSVDMVAPDAPEKIRYWHNRGLTGMRLFTAGSTFDKQSDVLADPRTFPAWEAAIELDISVVTQLRPEGLPQLLTLLKRFPNARIVVDALLYPNFQEGPPYYASEHVFCLANYENAYLKIITNSVRNARKGKGSPETFFPRLVSEFGANRIAWGSNFPGSEGTLPQMVEEAKEALACLSESDRTWIFSGTAQVLYPALKARTPA